MIVGHAHHGLAGLFEEMIKQGVNLDVVTFLGLLSSCQHGGLVKEGQVYFGSMVQELDHYSCIPWTKRENFIVKRPNQKQQIS